MNTPELFGSMVFGDAAMQSRLPLETYQALKKTIARGSHLELDVANVVAKAMKDWALEKGATHFSHWFQPMTGVTAEKHESFISPATNDSHDTQNEGKAIMAFSGKALVKGEPDASAFPSGGLRATFEARGYTAWDPTSYAFIKNNTLCIPTAFCSYAGDALDKKTPLLRSVQAINKQAMRILKLLKNTSDTAAAGKAVRVTVGAEQEYFLIDKQMYLKRPDLIYCGRTLFGAKPPKGQELEDHYFGAIKPRVSAFMQELNQELWKLGVFSKIEHNEAAPAQHELAPVFSSVNIAADHNQLTMELMKTVADKHGLTCLLHEKPFEGVNGSSKHINWSLSTDKGVNLFEPGETPFDNAQFLLFLVAVIKAADKHQDLLRMSAASAGNDLRLGENEAPPSIISVFLGDELTDILTAIENGEEYQGREKVLMEIGVTALPHFPKDINDRNRTSPFAFTGNKFEFRTPGSSASVADSCTVMNTIVADTLCGFADTLEKSGNSNKDLEKLIKTAIKEHKRIIFNGNNYSPAWEFTAEERGLLNLKTAVDALPCMIKKENIELFKRHGVFSESELHARYEVMLEHYCKIMHIEALTMLDLMKKEVIPAVVAYQNDLVKLIKNKKICEDNVSCPVFGFLLEQKLLIKLSGLSDLLLEDLEKLEENTNRIKGGDLKAKAEYYRTQIAGGMDRLRKTADEIESMTGRRYWGLPLYGEILYSVN
ncbi:MAG: glutamine synthetase III [Oscillospiraceae bacterium]|nr:glutamine synthetase III [Oscillospiraceae bacterium]